MRFAGTGHRPNKLGGYSQEVTNKLVALAKEAIIEHKATHVISGMALGWDTALALASVDLGVPFYAAVPFLGQERMWPKASQDLYRFLLEKADNVVYVCEPGYAPWKMQVRNEYMVDNCDAVLALWDGSDGGTGNCIKYATKVNPKPIINLWDKFKE